MKIGAPEKVILRAAAIRGENPPLLTVFDPAPAKRRSPVEKDLSKFPQPSAVQLDLPPNFQPRANAKAEAPFVWAAEAAFQRIQHSDIISKGTAMLTYLAHVRISNDVRSHTYRAHSIHLQKRAGLQVSAVKKSNRELARIGLLFIHRGVIPGTAGNEVNAYTLGTAYPREPNVGRSESDTSALLNPNARVRSDRGEPTSMYTCKERRTNTINRVSVPVATASNRSFERNMLAEIRAICGNEEIQDNGGLWTILMRESPDSLRAIKNAIEDWKLIRPDLKGGIKKTRGAFLMDRYKRSLAAIKQSNEDWKKQNTDSR